LFKTRKHATLNNLHHLSANHENYLGLVDVST